MDSKEKEAKGATGLLLFEYTIGTYSASSGSVHAFMEWVCIFKKLVVLFSAIIWRLGAAYTKCQVSNNYIEYINCAPLKHCVTWRSIFH